MLTIRAAAALLTQANSPHALHHITAQLGHTSSVPLDEESLVSMGIRDLVQQAWVAVGPGTLRCCIAHLSCPPAMAGATDGRLQLRQLAVALARHAPLQRWSLVTLDAASRIVCIATVTAHPSGPRVAVLRVDREHVVDSDADTLRSLHAVLGADRQGETVSDSLRHARFTDILRRDSLSGRFYRALEQTVDLLANSAPGNAPDNERRELALLCASRCLFLAFLQAKGWLDHDHDFLLNQCTTRLQLGGHLHRKLLRPLFFGTLNTPISQRAPTARMFGAVPFLNGGLFAPTPLETRHSRLTFSDDALVALLGDLLDRYRFTAHEDSADWSEAAIDPEMLGRAFECLMGGAERRSSGSFYTPPELVNCIVTDALGAALPMLPANAIVDASEQSPLRIDAAARQRLESLRVLDPACGSGAFLVHCMERLAQLKARCGDRRPLYVIRRDTLTRNIFGVDRNPMAVWLCELRLWLSVIIDCPETQASRIPPLPNLDHNIRVGDTLSGGTLEHATRTRQLTRLREQYSRATGTRKRTLARELERSERQTAIAHLDAQLSSTCNLRAELLASIRSHNLFGQRHAPTPPQRTELERLRIRTRELRNHRHRTKLGGALPFRFATHFSSASHPGFDLIVGNPPWVRPHALPARERHRLRVEYRTMRHAAWTQGARRAGASTGFAAQADLSAAFIERSLQLLAPQGTLALLVPAKLWRALAGGGTRQLLQQETDIRIIRDWSDAPSLFEAATYPSLIVATKRDESPAAHPIHVSIARSDRSHDFVVPAERLGLTDDTAAPWVLLPPDARKAFDFLTFNHTPLGDSQLGRPLLGVKCGCNAAFLVHARELEDDTARVTANGRTGLVDRQLLRPVLRGEAIGRARIAAEGDGESHIVWTHTRDGSPLTTLPPATNRWLSHWKPQLERRRDQKASRAWWTLFRTEAARADSARLVWADFGRSLRAVVLPPGDPTVPLNTCYVMPTPSLEDAYALLALLTSPIAAAWLECLAEPARGGFRRFLGWTVASLPIPREWLSHRFALAALGRRLSHAKDTAPLEHARIVAESYGTSLDTLYPLLAWSAHDHE